MLFEKVPEEGLPVGIYLGITHDGEKTCFEVCESRRGLIIFVQGWWIKNVGDTIAHYAPFPEIEYKYEH